jgi:hypothetical protein
MARDALPFLPRLHRQRDVGACLNQQPTVRVVVGPPLPVALVAPEIDNLADMLEGQVERRLPKLLHELPGVCFVARSRQFVMDGQAHVVSLAFMVQRPGQSVTHEVTLTARKGWLVSVIKPAVVISPSPVPPSDVNALDGLFVYT